MSEIKKPSISNHEISSLDADYPRNSLYSGGSEDFSSEEKPSSKPIIKKNTRGNQIIDGFKNVVDTVLWPALQRTASTMLKQMIDVLIYQGKGPNRSDSGDGLYISYRDSGSRPLRMARSEGIVLDDFRSRDDALMTLRWMRDRISRSGRVTVGALYDYLGESKNATMLDFSRGWSDLTDASIVRNGSRWSLELPEPM